MERPRVGVAAIVRKDGKVLLGKRIGGNGTGTWGFAGGKLDAHESPEDCAVRETMEETGLRIETLTRGPYTSTVFSESSEHYITLFVVADWKEGEVVVREPERCERWEWFAWDALPHPLFSPIEEMREANYDPFSI